MTKIEINGIALDSESKFGKVCQKYFIEKTSISQIAADIQTSESNVRAHLNHFRKMTSTLGVSNSPDTPRRNTNQILSLEVKEENERLVFNVKTCKDFEDYLIAHGEVRPTENLFATHKAGKFYYPPLVEIHNYLDNINQPVFSKGMINFSIFRIPGIGSDKGISFEVDGLLTEKQIQTSFNKLKTEFKRFYLNTIVKEVNKINVKLEVLEEK